MKKPFQLWVDALLSGNYKQISGHLKTDKGHCCLGILCEVYNSSNDVKLTEVKCGDGTTKFDDEFNYPPDKVIAWLKDSPTIRTCNMNLFVNELVIKNDNGTSFSQIAQYVNNFFEGV